ncbi:ABC transporter permease [Pelosinus baikalensis]|uniref:Proline/glycine betaine ABC transporter permease n=1 Tax=Pelosinus baikalensis TaxID=2892015 RepID=A0ABS8I0M4_9FIRM|nr:proline/glycine betaine ABC transporter permease [Pelosinus baikalensis]MCC5468374.1 proline/glycine betaine ABC transporter permease [Pelosinus baikalensis]
MYRLPLGQWVNQGVEWLLKNFGNAFDAFTKSVTNITDSIRNGAGLIPWFVIIIIFALLAWRAKGWRLALGTTAGLAVIYNLELWLPFLDTLILMLIASVVSLIIGIPLGIFAARSDRFHKILSPLLDFMQTMPSFVYLIPALMFFNLGTVSAVFATVIFSMPPVIRLTDLGIRQVPIDLVEVGEAFGSSSYQMLWKIQLPLAMPTIMAGINQTMMLSLSMVVISAMIGAQGLGAGVLAGISQMDIGKGFEYGLAVVILAMILDSLSQGVARNSRGTK